jgi:predicted  nucleic acid-binding Zn-ribbon protein
MAGTIETLRKLQGIDVEIAKLRAELDRWPAIVAEKSKDVEAAIGAVEAKAAEIKALRVEADGQELKLKSGEAEVGKVKGNLLKVKTNREYEAILKEIEGIKAENSQIEEKIIGLLDRIQALEADLRELKAEQKRAEGEVADHEKQARAECVEIEAEIGVLDGRRSECAKGVTPEVLEQYERIRLGRSGLAVVPVVDNVCQGCFMSLTAQEINTLLLSRDSLIQCRNCQRILFLENPAESGYDWEEPDEGDIL